MAAAAARPLVADSVFGALLESLLSGRYAPGEKLPPQRALAADLGVTMTALREALKRLEQMGLIEARHGDAMRVRDWREHGGLDVVGHLLTARSGALDAGLIADIFEARSALLRELAGLAAARRTATQRDRLLDLAEAVGAAADAETAQRHDFAFFAELAEAAGNLVFVLIVNSIRALYFERAAELPVTARPAELAPLYRAAAEAVAAGDADGARNAVAELAERQRRRVEEVLGR